MGSDVADAACGSRLRGVGAPGGLFLSAFLKARGEPALRILDDDFADFSKLARAHDFARFLDERVAGVVVRESVGKSATGDDFTKLLCFGEIEGGWLVGKHGKAVFERALRGGKMQVVRRDDRNEIHALAKRESGLGFHHFFEGSVAS